MRRRSGRLSGRLSGRMSGRLSHRIIVVLLTAVLLMCLHFIFTSYRKLSDPQSITSTRSKNDVVGTKITNNKHQTPKSREPDIPVYEFANNEKIMNGISFLDPVDTSKLVPKDSLSTSTKIISKLTSTHTLMSLNDAHTHGM